MRRIQYTLVFSWLVLTVARAEQPVHFVDPKLKAAVEEALWVSDPTPTAMLALTELDCSLPWDRESDQITDIEGLQYATNLQDLNLRFHRLTDISVLSALTNLRTLNLSENQISSVSALSGLSDLTYLNIHANRISNIAPLSGLSKVTFLDMHLNRLTDISALSGMADLCELDISLNDVGEISALAGLTQLSVLRCSANRISDLSPLCGVTGLEHLDLANNTINDISCLSGLSGLWELDLQGNKITDISPLCSLTSLSNLDLRDNPLVQTAFDVDLPRIIGNNTSLVVQYDSPIRRRLVVSSSLGGQVIQPGEGDFSYKDGQTVLLEAVASPGFLFSGWSGSSSGTQNPIVLSLDRDHAIRADFLSVRDVLYVDDNAPQDPKPGDATQSDPQEEGTAEHPADSVQEAIDVAPTGALILVRPGTYRENISVVGKSLHLIGTNPGDPNGGPCVLLAGERNAPVVLLVDNGLDCRLTGFTVTQGRGQPGGAIYCTGTDVTLTNCLVVGNRSTNPNGATVYCVHSTTVVTNCTIADNAGGPRGTAITLVDSDLTMTNSILWNDSSVQILPLGTSTLGVHYCAVRGSWADLGNIQADPLFAQRGYWVTPNDLNVTIGSEDASAVWTDGDYHLKSQAGRWDPAVGQWVQDEVTSPCLDAGDPGGAIGYEPVPNGGIINLGAYGGTTEASKSYVSTGSP